MRIKVKKDMARKDDSSQQNKKMGKCKRWKKLKIRHYLLKNNELRKEDTCLKKNDIQSYRKEDMESPPQKSRTTKNKIREGYTKDALKKVNY